MPSSPSPPILRHRSIGNSLLRSISAARGAISRRAKSATCSRSMSAVSPSPKSSGWNRQFEPCAMAHLPGISQPNPRLEQEQGREAEEREEAQHIRGRGEEWSCPDGWIDLEACERHRNQGPGESRPDHVEDHGACENCTE